MIDKLPVKIYVDMLFPDHSSAVITEKRMSIYAINKINELRNYKNNTTLKIEDESPVVQAGRYVCVKSVRPDMRSIDLMLFDPRLHLDLIVATANSCPDNTKYVLSLVVKYITDNYDQLKDDVELVSGMPDWLAKSTIITANP